MDTKMLKEALATVVYIIIGLYIARRFGLFDMYYYPTNSYQQPHQVDLHNGNTSWSGCGGCSNLSTSMAS